MTLGLSLLLPLTGCRKDATASSPPAAASPVTLKDTASETGLTFRFGHGGKSPLNIVELMGAGAGFVDYNNDGWLDVLCVSWPRPALFRSEGGRAFTDVTASSGLTPPAGRWYGCAVGDYDNDGWDDLCLTGHNRTALFRNRGNGTFADVTQSAGVGLQRWASSAAFSDVDRDGDLDLYVACYVRFAEGMPEFMRTRGIELSLGPDAYDAQPGVLFLNENGRFRDATHERGLAAAHGKALGVAFADIDDDGDDDLYVANDQQPGDLFRNNGKGHFTDVALETGAAFSSEGDRQGGMGLDFGDYDGDGRLDLFVANFADEPKSLYHATEIGIFEHAGLRAGVAQTTRPWVGFGTKFGDLDHDGRLDLALVNGHVQDLIQQVDPANPYPQLPQLFLNAGNGRFREVSNAVGPDFRIPLVGRALATGDYDNDGDLDLLAADLEGTPRLWRNEGGNTVGRWLMLRLTGTRSNRQALGARVEITVGGKTQIREARTDGSYLAANDPRVHFGLGSAERVDKIRIRWPSGAIQTLQDVPANQLLKVTEEPGERGR